MSRKWKFAVLAGMLSLAVVAVATYAADRGGSGASAAGMGEAEKPATTPTAEMQAQMAKMMEYGTPGEGHARLKPLEGNWDVTTRMWMKPGDEPQESKGKSSFTWILGGRFLRQDFTGDMEGQKFEGIGHIGYNNMRKVYVATWIDSMGTGIMQSTGMYDESKKTIMEEGDFSCPVSGEEHRWFRAECKMKDNDNHTYSMFFKDETGKEFKAMEIEYTRAK